ncbi:carbon-nitrogen hydrolase family protein [Nocardioides cynanchi]|uniref:carbon-nitrogen hydrolase family protein n=1 Tax=Nocardioides cynanchi TaxID=2558918 RepID=UPI0012492D79|nr:carbon-nitrogen hydrolase family protein [Nocardioides cynanchi]
MTRATVAAVQATPVFLDREATVEKACRLVKEAAAAGAALVVFPEAFVPAYPDWVWRLPAWQDGRFTHRLLDQAVTVPGPTADRLAEAARDAGVYLAIGVNELDGGTLYNTLLYFTPAGELAGRHRKLMPTGGERTVWGYGDGSTLTVVATPFGEVGGLICWENYMPLARTAMYALGVEIYLAPTWDNSPQWVATLQHIAKEGRVYVVGVAPLLRGSDVPEELRGDSYPAGDADWMSRGHTTIVEPGGEILAGPVTEREEILYAEIDTDRVLRERQLFDPVGHYARPDVFTLHVDTRPHNAVTFD